MLTGMCPSPREGCVEERYHATNTRSSRSGGWGMPVLRRNCNDRSGAMD
jgi:hypothetical protein